jgi:two-component system, NarL family, sensor histidine kinase DegS
MPTLEEFVQQVREEHEHVLREKTEIALLMDQSKAEVDRWAQRQASVTNQLRQIQQHLDTVPRADIKQTYDSAMDAQQKLFTMRGQLEKLQTEQANLERYAKILNDVLTALGDVSPEDLPNAGGNGKGGESEPLVMRLIDAQEAERQRMSKAMHDGPAQSLTNFVLQAEIVQRLYDSNPEAARVELLNLKAAATSTFQRVREFITELRPMMLDDLGLVPTVRRYIKNFEEKTSIQTAMTITGEERRFESHREVLAFRAIQEMLTNVRLHSQCSQVRVILDIDDSRLKAVVEDNGRGFDVLSTLAAQEDKHIGLRTLKEKAELLGGLFVIESTAGQGTIANFELPITAMAGSQLQIR